MEASVMDGIDAGWTPNTTKCYMLKVIAGRTEINHPKTMAGSINANYHFLIIYIFMFIFKFFC